MPLLFYLKTLQNTVTESYVLVLLNTLVSIVSHNGASSVHQYSVCESICHLQLYDVELMCGIFC